MALGATGRNSNHTITEGTEGSARSDGFSWAEVAERGVALLLLVLATPLVLGLAAFVLITDGRPAFYSGTRLGRGRKPFTIYKVRTLRRDAQKIVGGELLKHSHPLVLRGGNFLRDTRLDELPQLLNIVRGDMSFLGPRPERPEVYEAQCQDIPGYERRFGVRPGLIGCSQLFTPHGTSKRYRTLIDNGALRHERGLSAGAGLVAFTAWSVLARSARRFLRAVKKLPARVAAGHHDERRRLRRVVLPGGTARFLGDRFDHAWRIVDLHEEAVLLEGSRVAEVTEGEVEIDLELLLDRGGERPARRLARCKGRVVRQRRGRRGMRLVVRFQAASDRSAYVLHQYFLGTSLASPRAAWRAVRQPHPRLPARAGAPSVPRAPVRSARPIAGAIRELVFASRGRGR